MSKVGIDDFLPLTPTSQSREVLRENPDVSFLRFLNYSEEKYSAAINAEIKERWVKLNKGTYRDPITNEGGHRKIAKQVQEKYVEYHCIQRGRTLLWLLSERTLNILRTNGLTPLQSQESTDQAMLRFVKDLEVTNFPEHDETKPQWGPNEYFEIARPKLVADWGYPFYSTVVAPAKGGLGMADPNTHSSEETITGLNFDFWAAFLGGDHRLGHDVIFVEGENCWYFYDLIQQSYVPTSEEKVRLGLSPSATPWWSSGAARRH